jgi:chromosome segregation ATPase
MEEIDNIANELREKQELNSTLLLKLNKKDDNITELIKEKLQISKIIQEKDLIIQNYIKKDQENTILKEKLNESLNSKNDIINNLKSQNSNYEESIKKLIHMNDRSKKSLIDNKIEIQSLHDKLNYESINEKDIKIKNYENDIFTLKSLLDKLQNENNDYSHKLQNFKNLNSSSTEIQRLNSILKCSICETNKKDTVISKCFHCFCKQCIQDNIKFRNRKCPLCSTKFGQDDVHTIYLD